MKTKKDFEKYIYSVINKFSSKLLLERHIWEVKFGTKSKEALMECKFNYPYLNVLIHYSDNAYEKWKKGDDMIPYIVHEMCHPITDPLYCKATERYVSKSEILDERELLTDYICNIALLNK